MRSLSLLPSIAHCQCPGAYYHQWMGARDDLVKAPFGVLEDFMLGNH